MCIFSNLAEVEGTRIFVGANSGWQHFVIYQNKVANLAAPIKPSFPAGKSGLSNPWNSPSGKVVTPGNAMIFPVPAKHPITPDNLVSLDNCSSLLKDMWRFANPAVSMGITRGFDEVPKSISVYEIGLYTVVISNNANTEAVMQVIEKKVPADRLPSIDPQLIDWFAKMYNGWPLIIACFANTASEWSVPFGVFYDPIWPDLIFVPGADAHDGEPPKIGLPVDVNHVLMFGADKVSNGVPFSDVLKAGAASRLGMELTAKLPGMFTGVEATGRLPNGDWVIQLSDVMAGRVNETLVRAEPPGMSA
jgi:hypothetical protein